MPVERGARLRRVPQYCQARSGVPHHLSCHQAVPGVPHERVQGLTQAGLLYGDWRDAAVAVAGSHHPPIFGEMCLLRGMEGFHRFTHVSTQRYPGVAFDISCQKARAASCVMLSVIIHVCNGSCSETSHPVEGHKEENVPFVSQSSRVPVHMGNRGGEMDPLANQCPISRYVCGKHALSIVQNRSIF